MDLKIVNKSDKEAEIWIDDVIGWDENSWPGIKKQLTNIAESDAKKIIVNISSPGGFVSDGLMIHDALKMTKAQVETRVFGMTASAATVIAQAAVGGKRKMSSNSLYLVHHAMMGVGGNVNDIRAALDDLERVDERLVDIYIKQGANPDKLNALMDENNGYGKWIDADEALEAGLIDEIFEPSRAAASAVSIPGKDFFDKYKLPQITDEQMAKLTEGAEEKKSLLDKIIDLFRADESEEIEKAEEAVEETAPEETSEEVTEEVTEEIKENEEAANDEVAEDEVQSDEILAAKDAEIADIKAKLEAKEAELANTKHDLSNAVSQLSQLDAGSTKPGGTDGAIDNDVEEKVLFGDDLKKINSQLHKAPPKRVNKDPEKDK